MFGGSWLQQTSENCTEWLTSAYVWQCIEFPLSSYKEAKRTFTESFSHFGTRSYRLNAIIIL